LSDKEWQNIGLYLRKLYGVGSDDMPAMAKGFKDDADKKVSVCVSEYVSEWR
jgi:hypothetical protein